MAIRTVTAEEEGLAAAIASTEEEIFSEANGNEPLEKDGDKSLEEQGDDLEGRTNEADEEEPEELKTLQDDETEPEEEATEEEPARDEKGQFKAEPRIPPGRLREEADKRRALESEVSELRGRLDQLSRPQQTETKKAEPPDMFSDPEGWQKHMLSTVQQQFTERLVTASLEEAKDAYGENFTQAYSDLQKLGLSEKTQFGASPTVAKIWSSPNPGRALMNWHSQQNILREVGNDPEAYKDRLREELLSDEKFLATAVERARGSARGNGQARTITRLPSLNSETGKTHLQADPEMYNGSEGSVFDYATR